MPAVSLVRGTLAAVLVAAPVAACAGDHGDHGEQRAAAPAAARSPVGTVSPSASTVAGLSSQDKMWLAQAHQAGLAEIEAGELARTKGATERIRSLGAMLVTDHTRLDHQVVLTARQLHVPLPTAPSAAQIEQQHKLTAAASGRGFDRAWVGAMITAHRTAIAAGATEAAHGSSRQVVALAKQAAPVLDRHLRMLRQAAP